MKRCKICNGFCCRFTLDPQEELCDECFIKTEEGLKKFKMKLTLDVVIEHSSPEELIDYVQDFAEHTTDIRGFDLEFSLNQEQEPEQEHIQQKEGT